MGWVPGSTQQVVQDAAAPTLPPGALSEMGGACTGQATAEKLRPLAIPGDVPPRVPIQEAGGGAWLWDSTWVLLPVYVLEKLLGCVYTESLSPSLATCLLALPAPLYHTSQCLPGFMGEPTGHLKCSAKSLELLRVPMTRNLSGLCGSVTSPSCELSGVRTEHHTCARDTTRTRIREAQTWP